MDSGKEFAGESGFAWKNEIQQGICRVCRGFQVGDGIARFVGDLRICREFGRL